MLKLLANSKFTTVPLRACGPAMVSSKLCNSQKLKECRRHMSDDRDPKLVLPQERYHIWSLFSKTGDSVMELIQTSKAEEPTIKCSGAFDKKHLIEFKDSTVFPTPFVTLSFGGEYYLTIRDTNKELYAKPVSQGPPDDYNRFIHWNHYSYSTFESRKYQRYFLACNRDGTLMLRNVHNQRHPDARILFVVHRRLVEQDKHHYHLA